MAAGVPGVLHSRDGNHAGRGMTMIEWDDPEVMLRELLAVIYRDGGHHVEQHGLPKAAQDAKDVVFAMRQRLVELRRRLECQQYDDS
jgi:hypothetical protein